MYKDTKMQSVVDSSRKVDDLTRIIYVTTFRYLNLDSFQQVCANVFQWTPL